MVCGMAIIETTIGSREREQYKFRNDVEQGEEEEEASEGVLSFIRGEGRKEVLAVEEGPLFDCLT
jgi:hypothetical protein